MTQHWSFHATGGGIGIEISDLGLLTARATGSKVASVGTANANVEGLVALQP